MYRMSKEENKNIAPLLEDERFMREALKEAKRALEKDEVPIGAVIVSGGTIIARAHNLTEQLTDVTAHAEMQALHLLQTILMGSICRIVPFM
jgi:tRNA(adenine34) deaminase